MNFCAFVGSLVLNVSVYSCILTPCKEPYPTDWAQLLPPQCSWTFCFIIKTFLKRKLLVLFYQHMFPVSKPWGKKVFPSLSLHTWQISPFWFLVSNQTDMSMFSALEGALGCAHRRSTTHPDTLRGVFRKNQRIRDKLKWGWLSWELLRASRCFGTRGFNLLIEDPPRTLPVC